MSNAVFWTIFTLLLTFAYSRNHSYNILFLTMQHHLSNFSGIFKNAVERRSHIMIQGMRKHALTGECLRRADMARAVAQNLTCELFSFFLPFVTQANRANFLSDCLENVVDNDNFEVMDLVIQAGARPRDAAQSALLVNMAISNSAHDILLIKKLAQLNLDFITPAAVRFAVANQRDLVLKYQYLKGDRSQIIIAAELGLQAVWLQILTWYQWYQASDISCVFQASLVAAAGSGKKSMIEMLLRQPYVQTISAYREAAVVALKAGHNDCFLTINSYHEVPLESALMWDAAVQNAESLFLDTVSNIALENHDIHKIISQDFAEGMQSLLTSHAVGLDSDARSQWYQNMQQYIPLAVENRSIRIIKVWYEYQIADLDQLALAFAINYDFDMVIEMIHLGSRMHTQNAEIMNYALETEDIKTIQTLVKLQACTANIDLTLTTKPDILALFPNPN